MLKCKTKTNNTKKIYKNKQFFGFSYNFEFQFNDHENHKQNNFSVIIHNSIIFIFQLRNRKQPICSG